MALVETKDLSLSPKKVILLFLYSCVVSTFFSLSLRLFLFFFLDGPRNVCLTPPNLSHLFLFFSQNDCVRDKEPRFSNGKEKSSSSPLEEEEEEKKNNTWGHGGPETEIALEFENLSLSGFFYYSFPLLQNF